VAINRHYQRLISPPKGSFFLFGVGGVGKSTWAREQFPEAYLVDLLDESRHLALLANPGLLGLELHDLPPHCVVVLEEVQRVPPLLNTEDGIEVWPLHAFLAVLANHKLWP
jgi:hypothetical protein